jgi:hypothetical protein
MTPKGLQVNPKADVAATPTMTPKPCMMASFLVETPPRSLYGVGDGVVMMLLLLALFLDIDKALTSDIIVVSIIMVMTQQANNGILLVV